MVAILWAWIWLSGDLKVQEGRRSVPALIPKILLIILAQIPANKEFGSDWFLCRASGKAAIVGDA